MGKMMTWAPIPDFPTYEVSDAGHVRRIRADGSARPIKGRIKPNGYVQFTLTTRGGKRFHTTAQRLVLSAFIGPAPSPHHHGAHRDGVRTNNRLENLYWASPLENAADKVRHGTERFGERASLARLTESDVIACRRAYATGAETSDLARRFGVSRSAIGCAVSGVTWAHLGGAVRLRSRDTGTVRGACWCPLHKKYRARPRRNGKAVHLGYFETEELAGKAIEEWKRGQSVAG